MKGILQKMRAKIISRTREPERLVATAARNDYRSDGVIDNDFEELVENVDVDWHVVQKIVDERTNMEEPDELEDMPEHLLTRAKKWSLLKHLMRSGHWGPFEHPQATVSLEGVTRVSMAQITRHRHFTFDIMSLRYVDVETGEGTDLTNRFDSYPDDSTQLAKDTWWNSVDTSLRAYETLIEEGVDKEEARKVLGMGTKVNIVMSGNARAWMHLLNIRGKGNVQGEAREIADKVMSEMKNWMPYTFEYFNEQVLPMKLNP